MYACSIGTCTESRRHTKTVYRQPWHHFEFYSESETPQRPLQSAPYTKQSWLESQQVSERDAPMKIHIKFSQYIVFKGLL